MDYAINKYHRVATYIGYFILGLALALWALIIPYIKVKFNINEAVLGSLLMLLGVGAIISMIAAGKLVNIFGCKKMILLSIFLIFTCQFLISIIGNIYLLAIILLIFGINIGLLDVSLNIQSIIVEKAYNKKLMSGFHSMYSLGSFTGGLFFSFLLSLKLNLHSILNVVLPLLFILILTVSKGYIQNVVEENNKEKTKFSIKTINIAILLAGILCFAAYITEGVILDWSPVYLMENKSFEFSKAGIGFSIFFGFVTLGRLSGDYIASQINNVIFILSSTILASLGILLIVCSNNNTMLYIGFVVTGLGASNIIPLTISLLDKIRGNISLSSAVAIVSTIGYSGTLIGPALIGYIAHIFGLSVSFIIISLLLIFSGYIVFIVNRNK